MVCLVSKIRSGCCFGKIISVSIAINLYVIFLNFLSSSRLKCNHISRYRGCLFSWSLIYFEMKRVHHLWICMFFCSTSCCSLYLQMLCMWMSSSFCCPFGLFCMIFSGNRWCQHCSINFGSFVCRIFVRGQTQFFVGFSMVMDRMAIWLQGK